MLQDDLEKKYADIPEVNPANVQKELSDGFDPAYNEPLIDLGEFDH
jgi:hypothetical protein